MLKFSNKVYKFFNGSDEHQELSDACSHEPFRYQVNLPRLSSILPYRAYCPDSNIYSNADSVGCILKTQPLVGSSKKIQTEFNNLLCSLPDDAVVAITLYASPCIGGKLQEYVGLRERANVSALHIEIAKEHAKKIAASTKKSLLGKSYPKYIVRDYQIIISVTVPGLEQDSIDKITMILSHIKSTLNAANMGYQHMEPSQLIRFIRELSEGMPSICEEDVTYNNKQPINIQATTVASNVRYDKTRLEIGDHVVRTMYAEYFPLYASQGNFMDLIGGMAQGKGSKIRCPFILTLLIQTPKISEEMQSLNAAQWDKKSKNYWSNFIPLIHEINADHKHAIKQTQASDKYADAAFFVSVYTDAKNQDPVMHEVISHFNQQQWKLKPTGFMNFPSWLSHMPMLATNNWMADCKHYGLTKQCLASNAINIAPLQGEWKGHLEPWMLFIGVNGQLVSYDPTSPMKTKGANGNGVITGQAGSGKSFILQLLMQATHSLGGMVYGFDDGRSSEKMCKLHNGMHIDFSRSRGYVFNPFSYISSIVDDRDAHDIKTADGSSIFKLMLAQMAFQQREPTDAELGILEDAILNTWEKYQQDNNVTRIKQYLERSSASDAQNIAYSLTQFAEKGTYGHYFNGNSNLDLDNSFVMLEVGGIKDNHKPLLRVLIMMLMHKITHVISKMPRDIPKMVCADEAWQYFSNGYTAAFFDGIARTIRKYGGYQFMGSQGPGDWFKTINGKTIFENSTNKITLELDPMALASAKKNNELEIDDYKLKVLQNLYTVREQYSELVIEGPHGYSVVRSVVDDFQKVLLSTTPKIFQAMENLQSRGVSIIDAAKKISVDIKQGVI